MLATISASASSGREICGVGSRLGHGLPRPTSFLIRDILGKCNDSASSDSDDHNEKENPKLHHEKLRISSEEEQEKQIPSHDSSSHLPTLCCRECITGTEKSRTPSQEHLSPTPEADRTELRKSANHSLPHNQSQSSNSSEQNHRSITNFESKYHSNQHIHIPSTNCATSQRTSPDSCSNYAPPAEDRSNSQNAKTDAGFEMSSCSEDEWVNSQSEQFARKTFEQEQLQKSIFDKLKESSSFNQGSLYNGLYPSAQNLIDLNYAFNLRAASAFGIPQLTLPFLNAYRSSLHQNTEAYSLNTPKNLHKIDSLAHSDLKNSRFDPYPRYRLLDWPQGQNFSSGRNSAFLTLNQHEHPSSSNALDSSNLPKSDALKHDRRGFSLQSTSPTYSEHSQLSPPPEKRSIQLPAYFRSRLGGSGSSDETNSTGKTKKCRRSRTVFTELQMLGLEKRFEKQQYLSTPDRVELAELLGLSQLQVKTWYQNRRMKWKKQVMQGGGTEPPTKPKGRPRKVRPGDQQETSNPAYDPSKLSNNKPLDLRSSDLSTLPNSR